MVYITKVAPIVPEVEVSNATERRYVNTPQRKADPKDKNRPKRRDLKEIVLKKTGCNSTPEIKKYLIMLGFCLDLRLTSAWKAVRDEIINEINAIKAVTSVLAPSPPPTHPFKRGDRVRLLPGHPYFAPDREGGELIVWDVEGDEVILEYFGTRVNVKYLELILDF